MTQRRQPLLLRLLLIPGVFVRAFRRHRLDWRCWLLHFFKKLQAPHRDDTNEYWECDCGRRIGREAPRHPDYGGYRTSRLTLDAGWLEGGDWRPPC